MGCFSLAVGSVDGIVEVAVEQNRVSWERTPETPLVLKARCAKSA
jgi:hypothetical protein